MKEALFYEKLDSEKVKCLLCPKHCVIASGKSGFCRARKNAGGMLYAVNYGQSSSQLCLDPIEKKPLYHFYPGSLILSLGPNSCNLACQFCQNWNISQVDVNTIQVSPQELVKLAKENKSIGIAYTYTEPFTWYEFILETAPLVKDAGMKNVLVTNGYVEEEPLKHEEKLAQSLACHSAVKAGDSLTGEEMRELIRQLEQTTQPKTCPHGRPTMIHLSSQQLQREFGRTG